MFTLCNTTQVIGTVSSKPGIMEINKDTIWAKFDIVTQETYRNSMGKKITEDQHHRIIAWGKLALLTELEVRKGKQLAVHGKLIHRTFTDAEGVNRCVTEIIAREILVLGK